MKPFDDKDDEETEDVKPWAIVLALTEDMETALTEKACRCGEWDGDRGCPQCDAITTARNRAQRRIEKLVNSPRSARGESSPSQRQIDAEEACIDIFLDYSEDEVRKQPRATQIAWELGRGILSPAYVPEGKS